MAAATNSLKSHYSYSRQVLMVKFTKNQQNQQNQQKRQKIIRARYISDEVFTIGPVPSNIGLSAYVVYVFND